MSTFGETMVKAVSDYLILNNLKSLGQINGTILKDIADRTHTFYLRQMEQKEQALSDDQWLSNLQKKEGDMGLNVKQEYARAQMWHEQNGQQLTRRKFVTWLKNADRPLKTANPSHDKAPIKLDPYAIPSWDWMRVMATKWPRAEFDRPAYEEMAWGELPLTIRHEILKAYANQT